MADKQDLEGFYLKDGELQFNFDDLPVVIKVEPHKFKTCDLAVCGIDIRGSNEIYFINKNGEYLSFNDSTYRIEACGEGMRPKPAFLVDLQDTINVEAEILKDMVEGFNPFIYSNAGAVTIENAGSLPIAAVLYRKGRSVDGVQAQPVIVNLPGECIRPRVPRPTESCGLSRRDNNYCEAHHRTNSVDALRRFSRSFH